MLATVKLRQCAELSSRNTPPGDQSRGDGLNTAQYDKSLDRSIIVK